MKSVLFTLFVLYVLFLLSNIKQASASCFRNEDCANNGYCHFSDITTDPQGNCGCSPAYAGPECEYRRKSQLGTWLLSFIFGTLAADRFYLGYTGIGTAKIVCMMVVPCIFVIIAKKTEIHLFGCISVLISLGMFGWWLYDVCVIGMGTLLDYNGHAMWMDLKS
jgi:hypothetical protein